MHAARFVPLARRRRSRLWLSVAGVAAPAQRRVPGVAASPGPALRRDGAGRCGGAAERQARIGRGDGSHMPAGCAGICRRCSRPWASRRRRRSLVYSQTSFQASHISARPIRAQSTSTTTWRWRSSAARRWSRWRRRIRRWARCSTSCRRPRARRRGCQRSETCLSCHLSWDTRAVPGPFVMSTFPRKSAIATTPTAASSITREPLERRFGGWYVTGAQVPRRHMGNVPLVCPAPTLAREGAAAAGA